MGEWLEIVEEWRTAETVDEALGALQDLDDVVCEDGCMLYPETLGVIAELRADPGRRQWVAHLWDFLAAIAERAYYFADIGEDQVMIDNERLYQEALAGLLPWAWADVSDPDPQVRALAGLFIGSVRDQVPEPTVRLRRVYAGESDERVRVSLADALYRYCALAPGRQMVAQAGEVLAWLGSQAEAGSGFLVRQMAAYAEDPRWSPRVGELLRRARESDEPVFHWPAQQF